MRCTRSSPAASGRFLAVLAAGIAPVAATAQTNSYVPAAGGNWNVPGNWSLGHCPIGNESPQILVSGPSDKIVTYDWAGVSNFPTVTLNGSVAGFHAMLFQPQSLLTTTTEQIGQSGDAWHWIEGPAFLWVNDILYVGYSGTGTGTGRFHLETVPDASAGLYVGDICYVGYGAPGEFDHRGGFADVSRLYVGQSDPGTYWLRPPATGRLTVQSQIVIGNGDAGTLDQTGGTLQQIGTNGMLLGLNTGGAGNYYLRGGTLNVHHISAAWNGDGFFTQSGGAVNVAGDINIGCEGTHPSRSWYKLNEVDSTAHLNVGGDLQIGPLSLAKYEQEGGTAVVTGNIEIWDGDPDPSSSSYLYLGLNAGTLEADALLNHSGYFDQDGGVLEVQTGTNDSAQGLNLDNNADCRIRTLTHNAGTLWMWRDAILRGPRAFGENYWLCDFTNNATFQMGSAAAAGGSFRGILTNNGSFLYTQGDFSASTLINYGAVTLNNDFTCRRIVNHATEFLLPVSRWIHADGAGNANAVENHGSLTLRSGSHLDVGASLVVNDGSMFAGGPGGTPVTIHGTLENSDYLLPSDSALAAGSELIVTGGFTAKPAAELRIRIRGDGANEYDRLTIQGAAALGGELDVRFSDGFVAALGDRFYPLSWGSRTGQFNPVLLPTLPADLAWGVSYGTTQMRLSVVTCPGDNGDANCDNRVDFFDIDPFLLALFDLPLYQATYCGGICAADVDDNGVVNFFDIDPFLTCLFSGCP